MTTLLVQMVEKVVCSEKVTRLNSQICSLWTGKLNEQHTPEKNWDIEDFKT